MLLDAGMDTGPVLSQQEISLAEDETFGTLHDRMADLGAELLLNTLRDWKAGRVIPVAQQDQLATYAPPLLKAERRLKWEEPARRIVDTIRAFDPVPGAYGFIRGERVKFFQAALLSWKGEGRAGEIVGCTERGLVVLGGDNQGLVVGALQLAGQRRLAAAEFLRGHPLPAGSLLE
jgi:methionyl-tRNA formyltransferase